MRSFVKLLAGMHSLETFRAPAGKNSFSDKIDKHNLKNFSFNVGNSTEQINLANDSKTIANVDAITNFSFASLKSSVRHLMLFYY
jgi:hypothetical protein